LLLAAVPAVAAASAPCYNVSDTYVRTFSCVACQRDVEAATVAAVSCALALHGQCFT
jgi:hypothetical protein